MISATGEILELFSPQLDEQRLVRFNELVQRIGCAFPNYRSQLVQNELDAFQADNNDIESVKYAAVLNVLIDLYQQGWKFEVRSNRLYLSMSEQDSADKDYVRFRLSSERKAQFNESTVTRFIEKMEKSKQYNGNTISIRNLIGSSQQLIQKITNADDNIVQPYIQLVEHAHDTHTGYWLSDIWRYFRYTWSIPYKTMPGRNLFYLVRDAAQEYHPIIGIFALGNSVLNLTVRDNEIGWTVDAIAKQLKRKKQVTHSTQLVSGTNGKTVGASVQHFLESETEYEARLQSYCQCTIKTLLLNLDAAVSELYLEDLDYTPGEMPSKERVTALRELAERLRNLAIDNKKNPVVSSYEDEAKETLFKKKRASELARLLEATRIFEKYKSDSYIDWLKALMRIDEGRKAVNTALVANRKTKIGSNMMEIIVCGSIPPYNELLGGKLVSILACSPTVIKDYTERYRNQVSVIASKMKGQEVIRDSTLAFLGTTSLYAIGSSQYNRIKVPMAEDFDLVYKKMGITEGYGTVYFSKATTSVLMRVLELQDGGRRINNIFGEGTSPRFRLISRGMSSLGIKADAFLQHYSPRIVYSIELARNTNEFLRGETDVLDYPFDLQNPDSVATATQGLIDFWYKRWLTKRLQTVDIISRLKAFTTDNVLVSMMR